MTVECLTHDSRSAHVLRTIILVLNDFYWAVIPKYMLFLPDLTLLQWQFWLVWMDLPSAVCAGMLSLSFLNRSQRTGYATIWARSCPGVKEKKQKKNWKVIWVRIYLTKQRSEASVQGEGSELSSVELVHLVSVLTEIHLTLNLLAHYIVFTPTSPFKLI